MPAGPAPQVRRLDPADRDRALETVVAAFADDALLRWVWPEQERYAGCAPSFFGLLLDLRLAGGEVWAADGGRAVAMWDPPGGLYSTPTHDPWPPLQAGFTAAERQRWATFDAAVAVPADAPPHWYLGVLATAPGHQGQGLGSAVTMPVLAAADRAGQAAWLETMSARNLVFYDRLGFEVEREVDLPDGGPRCWLLRRDPRSPGG
jgi:ribosomal protein S18 acetylase RimI-like enzyme